MFKKRCGVPSAWQRFCLMPGYLPSIASKSSERLRAAHWNVSAPVVNLRSGGGMRRVMDTELSDRTQEQIKNQKAKSKGQKLNPSDSTPTPCYRARRLFSA